MIVVIGADHAGMALQDRVMRAVRAAGHEPLCVTEGEPNAGNEYPDIAQSVGTAIVDGHADRGILICGSGAGMEVAANKLPGIRAASGHDTYTAHQMVEHDNVNVVTLGARVIGPELAAEIVTVFLNARFTADERHLRRLAKVHDLERRRG